MKFAKRLYILRKEKGLSQKDLAAEIGVSPSSISLWEADKVVPEAEKILNLAQYFQVSSDYLLGSSNFIQQKSIITQTSLLNIDKIVSVPVFDRILVDENFIIDKNAVGSLDLILSCDRSENDFFAVKITDSSLFPFINEGDILLCQNTDQAQDGDLVLVYIGQHRSVFKFYQELSDGIILRSSQGSSPALYFSKEEAAQKNIRILAKAVELRRTL
ncbi:MAG: helix-turn-helix domain-containing protein [Bacillota bacterium]|nr:helix-turn-helix domain-containing protein [Bacillota bacterium]